jgi:ATP-dependent Clp protease ATP-binding subunit ClpB
VMATVRGSFKPEFLNRLDDIVIFDALTIDELAHIVDLQLDLLEKRLAVRRITISVTDEAKRWLADTGYDPAYGARPLRRLIQNAIGDPLAKMLIGGQVADGSSVTVDRSPDGDGLTLTGS